MWEKNYSISAYNLLISLHLHLKHLAEDQQGLLRTVLDSRTHVFKPL